MRPMASSMRLWCMLGAVAVLTVAMFAGCSKPAAPPAPPANPPAAQAPPSPAPAATTPSTTPAGKSEYNATPGKAAEAGKVQTAADPKNMTELEKKHVPQFALPKEIKKGKPLSVTVNVGQVPHPMKPEHYIQWIELYLDGKLVKKVALKPGDKPMAKFEIKPTAGAHKLMAHINCNIHGLWANTMEITAK